MLECLGSQSFAVMFCVQKLHMRDDDVTCHVTTLIFLVSLVHYLFRRLRKPNLYVPHSDGDDDDDDAMTVMVFMIIEEQAILFTRDFKKLPILYFT